MEEKTAPALPDEEEYRRYDRIWRRVSPELNPYPEVRAPRPPAAPPRPPRREDDGKPERPDGPPGAEALRELLRDELSAAQTCRYLARQAPSPEARRTMLRLAAEEAGHAKTLQALHFLLTGETYPVTVVLPPQARLPWRDRLRELWHAEADAASSYARAAERTRDASLRAAYERLSADERRHAETLQRLLEKAL